MVPTDVTHTRLKTGATVTKLREIASLIAMFMGPTWAHLEPTGPSWVPCWPHELCYLGYFILTLHALTCCNPVSALYGLRRFEALCEGTLQRILSELDADIHSLQPEVISLSLLAMTARQVKLCKFRGFQLLSTHTIPRHLWKSALESNHPLLPHGLWLAGWSFNLDLNSRSNLAHLTCTRQVLCAFSFVIALHLKLVQPVGVHAETKCILKVLQWFQCAMCQPTQGIYT